MNEVTTEKTISPQLSYSVTHPNLHKRSFNPSSSLHNTPSNWYSNRYNHSHYQANPNIITYNSEWVDTLDFSPSKPPRLIHSSQMSATQTTIKYETPSKSRAATLNYVTPTTDSKTMDLNEKEVMTRSSTPDPLVSSLTSSNMSNSVDLTEKFQHNVKNMDIFWAMLNNITGKDKMAKVGQYSLRLFLHWAKKTETYLSDDSINISIINQRYNNKEKQLNLILNFIKHPQDFIRIIVILVCSIFNHRLQGMVKGLSTYRQFLRFGKTPFRIRDLVNKIRAHYDTKLKVFNGNFFSNKTLGEVLSLYYGINDESTLLYKLNLFSNESLYNFVSKHEAIAWYYESWFALYNAYNNLQSLHKEEMDIKILIQVKKKAKLLSKQLLGGNSIRSMDSSFHEELPSTSSRDLKQLKDIQFNKNSAYLDIYKNISDIIFNTYTVFHLALPFDTLQIWMGISASTLSTIKIFRETKKLLIETELKKKMI